MRIRLYIDKTGKQSSFKGQNELDPFYHTLAGKSTQRHHWSAPVFGRHCFQLHLCSAVRNRTYQGHRPDFSSPPVGKVSEPRRLAVSNYSGP